VLIEQKEMKFNFLMINNKQLQKKYYNLVMQYKMYHFNQVIMLHQLK